MKTDATIIAELRMALRRQGVWGARAERLMQDWTGHVREDAVRREEEGSAPEAARDAAWRALGSPDMLAATAARELVRSSWLGRHPWLGGLALPALGWIAVVAVVLCAPAPLISLLVDHDPLHADPSTLSATMVSWQQAFNWLPWLLSMAWLARIAARMPGGWKLFWVTAIVLALCSPSVHMTVIPRLHGPGSGKILFFWPTGLLGMIASALRVFGFEPTAIRSWARLAGPEQTIAWIQTAIMALGALAFYARTSGRYRWPAAGAGTFALLLILACVGGVPTIVL
jgi:hypothetical protein